MTDCALRNRRPPFEKLPSSAAAMNMRRWSRETLSSIYRRERWFVSKNRGYHDWKRGHIVLPVPATLEMRQGNVHHSTGDRQSTTPRHMGRSRLRAVANRLSAECPRAGFRAGSKARRTQRSSFGDGRRQFQNSGCVEHRGRGNGVNEPTLASLKSALP